MPEGSILTECHHKMFLSSKIIIMPKFGHSALEEFYLKSYNLWKCHKKRPTTVHYKVCPLGLKRPPKKKKKCTRRQESFVFKWKKAWWVDNSKWAFCHFEKIMRKRNRWHSGRRPSLTDIYWWCPPPPPHGLGCPPNRGGDCVASCLSCQVWTCQYWAIEVPAIAQALTYI